MDALLRTWSTNQDQGLRGRHGRLRAFVEIALGVEGLHVTNLWSALVERPRFQSQRRNRMRHLASTMKSARCHFASSNFQSIWKIINTLPGGVKAKAQKATSPTLFSWSLKKNLQFVPSQTSWSKKQASRPSATAMRLLLFSNRQREPPHELPTSATEENPGGLERLQGASTWPQW